MRRRIHEDLEPFLERDREDEIRELVEEFTEEDFAFMDELNELTREFQ